MITKFKIFESSSQYELIDYVDENEINEFFDDNYYIDPEEAIYIWPKLIWDTIDDKKFVKDYFNDFISSYTLSDIDDDQLREFIKNHLTYKKEEKIRKLYLYNNEGEDIYDEDDYENMLDEFDDDDLKSVALEDNDEYDIIKYTYQDPHEDYKAIDMISDFYGLDPYFYNKKQNRWNNTYDEDFKRIKRIVWNYLDNDKIVELYKASEDDEYKKEYVKEFIFKSPNLQRNILKNNKEAILDLFELLVEEDGGPNIGDEYDFQKAFIEKYEKENPDEEDEDMLIPTALKKLNDEFGLNKKIRKEYKDYTILIDLDKYNL
jgi:hypothetical protein